MTAIEHLAEFRELLNHREVLSHRMVLVAEACVGYLNLGEVEKAKEKLLAAVQDYRAADEAITKFYRQSAKKNSEGEKHGNPADQSVAS